MRYILILFLLVYISMRIGRAIINAFINSSMRFNLSVGAKKPESETEKPPWDEKDVIDADFKELKKPEKTTGGIK